MTIEAGTRFGRYEIQALLGAGGMGEVYRALDTELNRPVALKFLPAEMSADKRRMERFIQEARAASALNHPNILTVYEIGREGEDSSRYFSTEFIDGVTLRQRIASSRTMKLGEVLDIAIQVASALAAAHAAGIVHRDIKPDNIMIRHDGYVKVLDFGLAKPTEWQVDTEAATRALVNTDPGTVMGTVGYMSPEQAGGKSVDGRTDIWSLGVVLYEMVTAHLPFEGATPSHVIVSILEREPPPLARFVQGVPEALELIVAEALTKDREERCQTSREMLKKLQRLKQRIDAEAEIERSVAPNVLAGTGLSSLSGGAHGVFEPTATAAHRTTARSGEALPTTPTVSGDAYPSAPVKRRGRVAWLAVPLFLALALALAFGLYRYFVQHRAEGEAPFASLQNMKFTRLPSSGLTNYAVISPDGKYIARVVYEAGKQSLRLRQVATPNEKELVAPSDDNFLGATFSNDGNFLYYVASKRGNPFRSLFRISALGGDPQKLVFDVDSAVTLSPDNKQLAFRRHLPKTNEETIVVANEDGSGEQTLASYNAPVTLTSPAWSPDGRVVAYVVNGTDDEGYYTNIEETEAATRTRRVVSAARWRAIGSITWLSDSSGLIINARDRASLPNTPMQIWHVAHPGGEARRVTNDLNNYNSVSLTGDARSLLAVQGLLTSHIWLTPGTDAARARQLTSSGINSTPSWTPDGRIVYDSDASGNGDIWVMNADGSGNRQLTFDPYNDTQPSVTPDGRFIIFFSNRSVGWSIWRINTDGSNARELVRNINRNLIPQLSPDSQWVYYTSRDATGKAVLFKVSIEGGEPSKLNDKDVEYVRLSPDGKQFLMLRREIVPDAPLQISLVPVDGGEALKTFEAPPDMGLPNWTPDGQSVDYIATREGFSNIWRLPLGGGKPRQLTDWKSDFINWFAWSRDAKQLAVARGAQTTDVLLIKDFR